MRWYWWLLFLAPPVSFLAALETARTAKSADEALGHAFFVMNFVIAGFVMAPVVVYQAAKSTELTRADRALIILMGVAVFPFVALLAGTGHYNGWPRGHDPSEGYPTLAAGVLWLGLLIAARRKLHRDIPGRWSQLASGLGWVLSLVPLVSMFLAVLHVAEPASSDSANGLRNALYASIALAALLVYRALFSASATRVDRFVIFLVTLFALALFLFATFAWWLLESWPEHGTPVKWAIYYGLGVAWAALAVATRLKDRAA